MGSWYFRWEVGILDGKLSILDGKFGILEGKFGSSDGKFGILDGKFGVSDGKLVVYEMGSCYCSWEVGILDGDFWKLQESSGNSPDFHLRNHDFTSESMIPTSEITISTPEIMSPPPKS